MMKKLKKIENSAIKNIAFTLLPSRMVMVLTILLVVVSYSSFGQSKYARSYVKDKSPFVKAGEMVQVKKDEIKEGPEHYISRYEKERAESASILKNAENNLEELKNKLDAVPPKGEFEKEADYNKRKQPAEIDYNNLLRTIKNTKSIISSRTRSIENQEKKLDELNAEIKKYEELSIPNNSGLQITEISTYDSEKEFFSVILQGISYKLYVTLNSAASFKQNYDKLVVYKYESTYWLEFETKWYKFSTR